MASSSLIQLKHLRQTALREALSSSTKVAEMTSVFSGAATELDANKADKAAFTAFSVAAESWAAIADPAAGSTEEAAKAAGYGYYADFALTGIKATDAAEVLPGFGSFQTARDCDLAPVCSAAAGSVRLFAMSAPAGIISGTVRIIQGG